MRKHGVTAPATDTIQAQDLCPGFYKLENKFYILQFAVIAVDLLVEPLRVVVKRRLPLRLVCGYMTHRDVVHKRCGS